MKDRTFLFLLCMLICFSQTGVAQSPYIHHYTAYDGLASNAVYFVYQDSSKYIWFATDAGVSRYDGSSFIHYSKLDGIHSNTVIRIKEDASGRIWLFNIDSSLNFILDGKVYNYSNAPYLAEMVGRQIICDFFEEDDHNLLFYSFIDGEVFRLDTLNQVSHTLLSASKFPLPDGSRRPDIFTIRYLDRFPDGDFVVWNSRGLYKMSGFDEEATLVFAMAGINNVFKLANGCYMLDTRNNSLIEFCYDASDGNYTYQQLPPELINYSTSISAVYEDVFGNLWVSTLDQGVFCVRDNKLVHQIDVPKGQAITQDHEKNIWISSMSSGVFKINAQIHSATHNSRMDDEKRAIYALEKHNSNGVWYTNGQHINLMLDKKEYRLDFPDFGGHIDQILHIDSTEMLINVSGEGCYWLYGLEVNHERKTITAKDYLHAELVVKRFIPNNAKTSFFAFMAKTLYLFDHGKSFDFVRMPMDERIYNGWYDLNNTMHLNTKRTYIIEDQWLDIDKSMLLFDNTIITGFLVINDSTELFVQDGDSLYLRSSGRLLNLSRRIPLAFNMQIKRVDYAHPYLFIATGRNVYVCESPLQAFQEVPSNMYPIDAAFRNIHDMLFQDGRLYIASDDGLTCIHLSSLDGNVNIPPIPYFHSVRINDELVEPIHAMLKFGGNAKLSIGFGSINYSDNPVVYSYLLEGVDTAWESASGTHVIYSKLPKGEYTFRLRVQKPTSDWSDEISFAIKVRAPFRKHPLFIILATLFAGFLVFLLIVRKNKLELKRRSMEHQLVLLEQKALQSQMNPHFIFNTLGSIQSYMLQNKPEEAAQYLTKFAQLTRKTLASSASSMISLSDEIDRLNIYLELEQLRMDNSFKYTIDTVNITNCKLIGIPSMIVQPIVENAIWHGVSSIEGQRNIAIQFVYLEGDVVRITIEDNGVGMVQSRINQSDTDIHMNLGMKTTQKRLKLLGEKMQRTPSFSVEEVTPGAPEPGTRVIMVVPCIISSE